MDIFERKQHLGHGMPYGEEGASLEHITNVSGNELPDLPTGLAEWVRGLPEEMLERYGVNRERFTQDKILPRLLFGRYLEAQFQSFRDKARKSVWKPLCI